jgi:putative transcriptional regulator
MKNKVKVLRNQFNITQKELADEVNVSVRTIISLEKEQYNPSIMLAYRIAVLFRTTIEDLYCLEENKKLEDEKGEN